MGLSLRRTLVRFVRQAAFSFSPRLQCRGTVAAAA